MIKSLFLKFKQIRFSYFLKSSYVRVMQGGMSNISRSAVIKNCRIIIDSKSELIIQEGAILENVNITLINSKLTIGQKAIIKSRFHRIEFLQDNASTTIENNTKIACYRIWCRFGGCLRIGQYTNINDWSEVRCDESVTIGSFNQISYNVRIWDTNTHCILSSKERRELTIKHFPSFGYEKQRPTTKYVKIGNDCWIGEYSAILKGVTIGNNSIVGFGTFISNKEIPSDCIVVNHHEISVKKINDRK